MTTTLLIFGSSDEPGFNGVRQFAAGYANAKFVDRLTSNYTDLVLVARHKVVSTPTIIILSGSNREIVRMRELPSPEFMRMVLESVES